MKIHLKIVKNRTKMVTMMMVVVRVVKGFHQGWILFCILLQPNRFTLKAVFFEDDDAKLRRCDR